MSFKKQNKNKNYNTYIRTVVCEEPWSIWDSDMRKPLYMIGLIH